MLPEPNIVMEKTTSPVAEHIKVGSFYLALLAPFVVAGLLFAFVPSLRDGLGMLMTPYGDEMPPETALDTKDVVTASGSITLSLKPLGTEGMNTTQGLYTYDMDTQQITPVLADQKINYFGGVSSLDGTKTALVSMPQSGGARTLMLSDDSLKVLEEVLLNDSNITHFEPSSWSPDGTKLALTVMKGANMSDPLFKNYEVYVYNLTELTTTRVGTGKSPTFTSNDTLIVLQEDGVHQINVTDQRDTLAVPTGQGPATGDMTLALSPDGTTLAWSVPAQTSVYLIDLVSADPFIASESELRIDAYTLNPVVFSPDGRQVSILEYTASSEVEDTTTPVLDQPQLSQYDVRTGDLISGINLGQYVTDSIFMSNWK